ncbi:MAG: hypothetical protein BYD32DRAFT_56282 [Podila humilis]|nr:MAG: hypothetical protein BYD32DRAFT_56282 [Podila humilis]
MLSAGRRVSDEVAEVSLSVEVVVVVAVEETLSQEGTWRVLTVPVDRNGSWVSFEGALSPSMAREAMSRAGSDETCPGTVERKRAEAFDLPTPVSPTRTRRKDGAISIGSEFVRMS